MGFTFDGDKAGKSGVDWIIIISSSSIEKENIISYLQQ
jgi:hypothetical protein